MKDLKVALEAAAAGTRVIMKYYGKTFGIKHKGETDLVTEVDVLAQNAIAKVLKRHFKSDSILAEEGELSKTTNAERRWIVDPIDGTTNFAHGYPCFCVSVALEEKGELKVGVVHDPTRKEVFYAVKGKGAFLNKKKIQVSKTSSLRQSLLVTGFPYDLENPEYNNVPIFMHMIKKAQAVRRDGSAALDLAYTAAGRFDGFWELSLKAWDSAAGVLLVREAGGIAKHFSGRDLKIDDHAIIAGNPQVFSELIAQVQAAWVKPSYLLMEAFEVTSSLDLKSICKALETSFKCASFKFDAENESEWGEVIKGNMKLNVSRKYRPQVSECFTIILILLPGQPSNERLDWTSSQFIDRIGKDLAKSLKTEVRHLWSQESGKQRTLRKNSFR